MPRHSKAVAENRQQFENTKAPAGAFFVPGILACQTGRPYERGDGKEKGSPAQHARLPSLFCRRANAQT
jgi:hypothetical protein